VRIAATPAADASRTPAMRLDLSFATTRATRSTVKKRWGVDVCWS
jgi:hypothetical protein